MTDYQKSILATLREVREVSYEISGPLRIQATLPPEPVGYWLVGNHVSYPVTKRPRWFHRKMTTLLLGWEWIEK